MKSSGSPVSKYLDECSEMGVTLGSFLDPDDCHKISKFEKAARAGNVAEVSVLLPFINGLKARRYHISILIAGFRDAANNDHIGVMDKIWNASDQETRNGLYSSIAQVGHRTLFYSGKVNAAIKVLQLAPSNEVRQNMLSHENSISCALRNNHKEIVKVIVTWSADKTLEKLIPYVAGNMGIPQAQKDWFLAYNSPESELGKMVIQYTTLATSRFSPILISILSPMLVQDVIGVVSSYISIQDILLYTASSFIEPQPEAPEVQIGKSLVYQAGHAEEQQSKAL